MGKELNIHKNVTSAEERSLLRGTEPDSQSMMARAYLRIKESARSAAAVAVLGLATLAAPAMAQSTLTASAVNLDFPYTVYGTKAVMTETLTCTGSSTCTISSSTQTGSSVFTYAPAVPSSIAAGKSSTLKVTFDPTAPNAYSGGLQITSNATNSPLKITFAGQGVNSHSVTLSWNAGSGCDNLDNLTGLYYINEGYLLFRANAGGTMVQLTPSGSPIPVSDTSTTDATVVAGSSYTYGLKCETTLSTISGMSNIQQVTIPFP